MATQMDTSECEPDEFKRLTREQVDCGISEASGRINKRVPMPDEFRNAGSAEHKLSRRGGTETARKIAQSVLRNGCSWNHHAILDLPARHEYARHLFRRPHLVWVNYQRAFACSSKAFPCSSRLRKIVHETGALLRRRPGKC